MTGIIMAGVLIAGIGVFIGVFLGVAGEKFEVEVDERETKILEKLPGNNCGGCGYPGCAGLATAIVKGEAPINQCPVGGNACAKEIGKIMGIVAKEDELKAAFVKCIGTCDRVKNDYNYVGLKDCAMAKRVPGAGPKSCDYGCIGLGSCVDACSFNAIHIVNGVAVVDKEACKACGKCVSVCPNSLIELVPYSAKHIVQCSNREIGKLVMQNCSVGCIACRICEKNCPVEAITVKDNVAYINQSKCTQCGICVEKCPKKIIL